MAVTNLSFAAQVDEWVAETEQRMTAVFRQSTQETVSIAQSLVPIDTGFLRASVRASRESMPPIDPKSAGNGSPVPFNSGNITLTIADARLGDTIFVGYTANYALYVHDGTSRMAPRPFVALAAQQWSATVNRVTEDLKARVGR